MLLEILVGTLIVIAVISEIIAKLRHISFSQELTDIKNFFKKTSTDTAATVVTAASTASAAAAIATSAANTSISAANTALKASGATTGTIIQPIVPPNPGQPLPPTVPISGSAPFTIDPATGFISVASLGGITQTDIVADGWLCSVLALTYLDPKSANYARVLQNCARDAFAEAESKALGTTIFANTAYDVVLQADGTYKTDATKSMLKNFIVPTEVNTINTTQAFCNAYPVLAELAHVDATSPGTGHAIALAAARRAKKAA